MKETPGERAKGPRPANRAPKKQNVRLQAARGYASRGWKVFPCKADKKVPATAHGFKDASSDRENIERCWVKNPDANIAIATGSTSGIVVLDVDVKKDKDGEKSLRDLGIQLPATYEVRTPSGGRHLYFALPVGAAVRNSESKLGRGLDVRGDGGYVIAPPSMVGGKNYAITSGAKLAPAPDWLIKTGTLPSTISTVTKVQPGEAADLSVSISVIRSALRYIPADDRDTWMRVGWAIGRGTARSSEGFAAWLEWSRNSSKHDPTRDPATMATEYAKAAQMRTPKVTLATLFYLARKGGWHGAIADGDHYKLAQALIEVLTVETGERPVYAMGSLWTVSKDALWIPIDLDRVAVRVGDLFGGTKYAKRAGDFRSVAWLAASLALDDEFFQQAPVGIASPSGIWVVTERGEIRREALAPAHRQRFRVAIDPDIKNAVPKRFLKLLSEGFDPADCTEQVKLVQQLFGAALVGSLWRYRLVGLFVGVTSSGKSVALNVLASVFPRRQVAAVSPQKWSHEYFVAALAGIKLNVVGELDPKDPIPAGAFKAVTGRDVVQGRNPTHRPFSFVCEAAHFFNANRCPPTSDRSDAFFRRWRVVRFSNSIARGREIRDLDEQIKREELGEFLGWALRGAAEVARTQQVIETATHHEAISRWRVENNSALAFASDSSECSRFQGASISGQALFAAYLGWSATNGFRPFGRSHFYDALAAGGAGVGIRLVEREHQVVLEGIELARRRPPF